MTDDATPGRCARSIEGVCLCPDCASRDDEPVRWLKRPPREITGCGRCGEPLTRAERVRRDALRARVARQTPASTTTSSERPETSTVVVANEMDSAPRPGSFAFLVQVSQEFSRLGFTDVSVKVDRQSGAIEVWANKRGSGVRSYFKGDTVFEVVRDAESPAG